VHHVQFHLNLAELIICLDRVVRPSKLQWAKLVKIRNPVDVGVWAMLDISLPSVVLIHHSIGQELQDVVLAVQHSHQVNRRRRWWRCL
jgi:hypothetical protein